MRDRITYQVGDLTDPKTYGELKTKLQGSNCIFYLAVAPRFFGPVIEHLANGGLMAQAEGAFRRLVVEKPFGHDLASAKELKVEEVRRVLHARVDDRGGG